MKLVDSMLFNKDDINCNDAVSVHCRSSKNSTTGRFGSQTSCSKRLNTMLSCSKHDGFENDDADTEGIRSGGGISSPSSSASLFAPSVSPLLLLIIVVRVAPVTEVEVAFVKADSDRFGAARVGPELAAVADTDPVTAVVEDDAKAEGYLDPSNFFNLGHSLDNFCKSSPNSSLISGCLAIKKQI